VESKVYGDHRFNLKEIARRCRAVSKERIWLGDSQAGPDWHFQFHFLATAKRVNIEGLENQFPPENPALKPEAVEEFHRNSQIVEKYIDEMDIYEGRYVDPVTNQVRKTLKQYLPGQFEEKFRAYAERKGSLLKRIERNCYLATQTPRTRPQLTMEQQEMAVLEQRRERNERLEELATEYVDYNRQRDLKENGALIDDPRRTQRSYEYYAAMLDAQLAWDPLLLHNLRQLELDWVTTLQDVEDKCGIDPEDIAPYKVTYYKWKEDMKLDARINLVQDIINKREKDGHRSYDDEHVEDLLQYVKDREEQRLRDLPDWRQQEILEEERVTDQKNIIQLYLRDKHPELLVKKPKKKVRLNQKIKKRYLTIQKYKELEKKGLLMSQLKDQPSLKLQEERLVQATAEDKALVFSTQDDRYEDEDDKFGGEEQEARDKPRAGIKIGKAGTEQPTGFLGSLASKFVSVADNVVNRFSPSAHLQPVQEAFVARAPHFMMGAYMKELGQKMTKIVEAYITTDTEEFGRLQMHPELVKESHKMHDARVASGKEQTFEINSATPVHNHFAFLADDGTPVLGFRAKFFVTLYEDAPNNIYQLDPKETAPKLIVVRVYVAATPQGSIVMTDKWLPPGRAYMEVKITARNFGPDILATVKEGEDTIAPTEEEMSQADQYIQHRAELRRKAKQETE